MSLTTKQVKRIAKTADTYCAFCGFAIPLDDLAATKIKEHVYACPEHPLRREIDAGAELFTRRTNELSFVLREALRLLGLCRSVRLSGEEWDAECEAHWDAVLFQMRAALHEPIGGAE